MDKITLKMTYFKPNGKFYADGEFNAPIAYPATLTKSLHHFGSLSNNFGER
ncbi:hypothetical protein [Xenorhabdus szentirmaii]|uniref:Uncharacterized protein n=1 Tax=Xenorhabdus szentirmaii DSM 16338 TaxID=1427518 RepID=W1IRK5_9GAMM|nr:hypothetical protein [Xenorhabdus szentirmaii]PHM30589.1 hypothetical protein Xsze_04180 [Xenorhabdus szentirmaii DSM 16338]CDL81064.1 hypothetical protein XSR1_100107 [Xenorhabdus szentirmaii DSM 16338]